MAKKKRGRRSSRSVAYAKKIVTPQRPVLPQNLAYFSIYQKLRTPIRLIHTLRKLTGSKTHRTPAAGRERQRDLSESLIEHPLTKTLKPRRVVLQRALWTGCSKRPDSKKAANVKKGMGAGHGFRPWC